MVSVDVATLSDEQCVVVLRAVAKRWLEKSGVDAFISYQTVQTYSQKHRLTLPQWLDGPAMDASPELAKTSRVALDTIVHGENEPQKEWVVEEIKKVQGAHAQMVDPISLSILGATLIGCILAARVKKVGSVGFYEGIPPELAKVIKAAAPTLPK